IPVLPGSNTNRYAAPASKTDQIAITVERRYILQLKPSFPILKIRPHKILVRLGQINDAFDPSDDPTNPTHPKHQLHDSLSGVTHDEFVNTKSTDEDGANSRRDFFVRSHRFPVHEELRVDGLQRLLVLVHRSQNSLTVCAIVCVIVVRRAALCAISHFRFSKKILKSDDSITCHYLSLRATASRKMSRRGICL